MGSNRPLIETVPPPGQIRARLSDALREAELLRKLLRLQKRLSIFGNATGRRAEKDKLRNR